MGKKTTITLTKAQLGKMLAAEYKQGQDDAINHAFLYMIGVPLNVLYHDYWGEDAKELAPEFTSKCFALFDSLQDGIVTHEEIVQLIEDLTGITVEASWLNRKENRNG